MIDAFEKSVDEIAPVVQALIMSSGDVLAMRAPDSRAIAVQLAQGGLRLVPGEATHAWSGVEGVSAGVWAPVGEVAIESQVPDISGLSLAQKSALLRQLKDAGLGGPGEPPALPEGAEVEG